MKVTFLGICANQTASYEAVSLIVDSGPISILIDAGPGVVRQLQRAGRRCTEIAHVFITHSHGDHTLGFPYFVWNHFYEGLEGIKGPEKIHVYAFPRVNEGLDRMLSFCYDITPYPFEVEYHALSEGGLDRVEIGETTVQTIPVDHTTPNYGLRVTHEGRSIAYSSDTIYHEGFAKLANGVDLLIHEAFVTKAQIALSRKVKHATAEDAGRCSTNCGAGALALVHLFPPHLEAPEVLIDEAKAASSCEVFLPEELMVRAV